MSEKLLVSTRKGLFICARRGAGRWEPERVSFLGDPVTLALHDARSGTLYAALNLGHFGVKLHRSADSGASWKECAVPAYPEDAGMVKKYNGPDEPAKLELIWALETGGKDEPGLLWAGTIPGALFRSRDGGDSWEMIRSLWDKPQCREWMGGGYPHAGIHSVCVHPKNPRHVTVAVSCGGVWQTTDGGETWASRAKGMRNEYMPPGQEYDENSQDPHHMVQCPASPEHFWAQHHNGIFRSADGAASWEEVSKNAKPACFGFAVAVHPKDPLTAWFVPGVKDEKRIPVDGKLAVSRTRDGGKSFEVLREGLPQEHCYDLVYRHGLAVDETGKTLAFGSTTGGLWVSENGGDSWRLLNAHLPPVYAVRFE
jgi:photosystem II stability/assembly factor-like uncharacterized protein